MKKKNQAEDRLARLVTAFRQTYSMTEKGIEALAGIYKEAHALDPSFGHRLRDNGIQVSEGFLANLLKVAEGKLYSGMLLQSRGLLRLHRMSLDDQKTLCNSGVMVYMPDTKDKQEKRPLCRMTNDQLQMVVTTQGRIRSVDEQKTWRDSVPRKGGKGVYTMTAVGVRFNTHKVWTPAELELVVKEWKRVYDREDGK